MKEAKKITPIILAGGQGTRLRPLVKDRPKPLALVNGRPFITYLLDFLKSFSFSEVIIATGYRGEMFPETLGTNYKGTQLFFSQEKQPLGTGGAVVQALSLAKSKRLLILNGDSYLHCNLEPILQENHQKDHASTIPDHSKAKPLLFVTWLQDTRRYGQVKFDQKRRILAFKEKGHCPGPGWINAGLYLLPRDFFVNYKLGQKISLEREIVPSILQKGLFAHCCPGPFIDIGTPESYVQAERFFNSLR